MYKSIGADTFIYNYKDGKLHGVNYMYNEWRNIFKYRVNYSNDCFEGRCYLTNELKREFQWGYYIDGYLDGKNIVAINNKLWLKIYYKGILLYKKESYISTDMLLYFIRILQYESWNFEELFTARFKIVEI